MRKIETKTCAVCEEIFEKKINCSRKEWDKSKFCSKECQLKGRVYVRPRGGFKKGITPWNKGMFGVCTNTGRTHIKKGQHLSPDTELKKGLIPWSKGKRNPYVTGSKNNKWKGGITALVRQIRNSPEMKVWRMGIFKRDKYTCLLCGRKRVIGDRVILEADHYPKKFSLIVKDSNIKTIEDARNCKELWDISNGRTLCRECHLETLKL